MVLTADVACRLGYASIERYAARCSFLFEGLALPGKKVLDVGCGRGTFAIWAALQGASFVLGIEPESKGSTFGTLNTFREIIRQLALPNIQASGARFEELTEGEQFDLIVLYNVINHLDEIAVQSLHKSREAQARYEALAVALKRRLLPGGLVILADSARSNLWGSVHIRSPFAPTIVWHKHQDPQIWRRLFERMGFRLFDLRWSPLYPFGKITANRFIQKLTASHFVLRMYG